MANSCLHEVQSERIEFRDRKKYSLCNNVTYSLSCNLIARFLILEPTLFLTVCRFCLHSLAEDEQRPECEIRSNNSPLPYPKIKSKEITCDKPTQNDKRR